MKDRNDNETRNMQVTNLIGDDNTNPDPLTGEHGARPIATGVGAVGGAVAGAAVGTVAGPIGTVVGGVVGAVAGGLAGKGVAEAIDPTTEETYWRATYMSTPYFVKTRNFDFDDYGPAYRYGWESHSRHVGDEFNTVESELARDWDTARGRSRLGWTDAKGAVQAAWMRVSDTAERLTPGDSDHDGK